MQYNEKDLIQEAAQAADVLRMLIAAIHDSKPPHISDEFEDTLQAKGRLSPNTAELRADRFRNIVFGPSADAPSILERLVHEVADAYSGRIVYDRARKNLQD